MKSVIRQLDERFKPFYALRHEPRPPKGWIRAIRDALGMTGVQFGKRMGVAQPRVLEIEKGEISGSITLNTLNRAAEALGCTVVYTLIPHRPLHEMLEQQAKRVALRLLCHVEQTMSLEDQAVKNKIARNEMLEQLISQLLCKPARLWDEE
jgi:predicted DNA-binding mobile mystery protein A